MKVPLASLHQIRNKDGTFPVHSVFLSCLYDIPMKLAARYLGISSNTLKRISEREGLTNWPCHELYQERHQTINLRDVYSGRESMIAQLTERAASNPKEKSTHVYLNILVAVKKAAENYNVYRGNTPQTVDAIAAPPSSTNSKAKSAPSTKPMPKTKATLTLTSKASPTILNETDTWLNITSTTRVDSLIAAVEGIRVRREEEDSVLARKELEIAFQQDTLPEFSQCFWPLPSENNCILNSLNLSDAIRQDRDRTEEELLLGPVPPSLLFF